MAVETSFDLIKSNYKFTIMINEIKFSAGLVGTTSPYPKNYIELKFYNNITYRRHCHQSKIHSI
jgi:hypothetical protein